MLKKVLTFEYVLNIICILYIWSLSNWEALKCKFHVVKTLVLPNLHKL